MGYLEPNQIFAMELFLRKKLTVFRNYLCKKSFIVDGGLGSKYTSGNKYGNLSKNLFYHYS